MLETGARVWDPSGSTSADQIRLDQESGDFTAERNVASSRLPGPDEKKNSQMLSGDAPVQAKARLMVSTNRNRKIHYQGGASMWQGANRIQAETIDIDREKRSWPRMGTWSSSHCDENRQTGRQAPNGTQRRCRRWCARPTWYIRKRIGWHTTRGARDARSARGCG